MKDGNIKQENMLERSGSVISNLQIYFRPTSLFNTLVMLVLLFGGLGLIARSVKSSG